MPSYPLALLNVLVILVTTSGILFVGHFFSVSSTLSYILSGIILGPYALDLISDIGVIRLLGDIGILFLLFKVGLELPLNRLKTLKKYIFGVGLAQVSLTAFFLTLFFDLFFSFPLEKSLFLGSILAFSSTALVIQLLAERSELATQVGRLSFSILLFQDLFVIALFIVVMFLAEGQGSLSFVRILGFIGRSLGGVLGLFWIGRFIIVPFFEHFFSPKSPEAFIVIIFSILFSFTYAAFCLGVPVELGAFCAGVALSETSCRHDIEKKLKSFKGLFLGFFFVVVGLDVRLDILFQNFGSTIGFLVILCGLKAMSLMCVSLLFGLEWMVSWRITFLLAGCGEFVLILCSFPHIQQWLGESFVQLLMATTTLSMLLTPGLSALGVWISESFLLRTSNFNNSQHVSDLKILEGHVIVVGLGSIAEKIANLFDGGVVSCVWVDKSVSRVYEARAEKRGLVILGDARDLKFFEMLQPHRARLIIFACPGLLETVVSLKDLYPHVDIVVPLGAHYRDVVKKSPALPNVQDGSNVLAALDSIGVGFQRVSQGETSLVING